MKSLFGIFAILLVAHAILCANAEDSDQLTKIVQEQVSKQDAPAIAADKAVEAKPVAQSVNNAQTSKESESESSSSEEDKKKESERLTEIVKEVEANKDEVKADKNTAKEETSDESKEDSAQSESEESGDNDDSKSGGKSESKSDENSESQSEESDDDDSEEDSEEEASDSKSDEKTNVVISNNNNLQSGHHAALKDQLIATDEENVHVQMTPEPKKFNQTFLIIAIGVLAVVCFALAIALIVKRRVINSSNKREVRSPRNPIYQEVTQTETA